MVDPRLMKALVHPTRIHIMDILSEGENSPSGIQKRIGDISLDLVSKHIKILRDLGVIDYCGEVKQKGKFTEHIYRITDWQFLTAEEWKEVDPDDRPSATTTILRVISEDVGRAYLENKFDERVDNHLSRSPLRLDEEGWEEVVKALKTALDAVLEAHNQSQERSGGAEEKLTHSTVVMMQFPLDRDDAAE